MTKDETVELLAVIKVAYPQQLGKISDIEAAAMVNLWADTFKRVPKEVAQLAAKSIVRKAKFFPSVADMCEELDALNRKCYVELLDDHDEKTKRNLEYVRQATADFAVTKMTERRADGAKDWLLESLQDKQLQLATAIGNKNIEIAQCVEHNGGTNERFISR